MAARCACKTAMGERPGALCAELLLTQLMLGLFLIPCDVSHISVRPQRSLNGLGKVNPWRSAVREKQPWVYARERFVRELQVSRFMLGLFYFR